MPATTVAMTTTGPHSTTDLQNNNNSNCNNAQGNYLHYVGEMLFCSVSVLVVVVQLHNVAIKSFITHYLELCTTCVGFVGVCGLLKFESLINWHAITHETVLVLLYAIPSYSMTSESLV